MEEAATQEGRAKQLEDEIKELRSKHKKELQEEVRHRELLQMVTFVVASQSYALFSIKHKIISNGTSLFVLKAH